MKYAIKFYNTCKVLSDADEIIIKYNEINVKLFDFCKEWHKDQRIILNITELPEDDLAEAIAIFEVTKDIHENITVLMSEKQDYEAVADAGLEFFFAEYVSSYDDLCAKINCGVSDVYIVNEMGFDLERISDYCHEEGVQIRCFPNIAQSDSELYDNTLTKFFIRPEGIPEYEGYIDVLEFFGKLDKQGTLFNIYKDEIWYGDLQDIILGLNDDIDNMRLLPTFDAMRVGCQKRCNFSICDICAASERFSKVLEEEGLGLIARKAKHEHKFNEEDMQNESAATLDTDAELLTKEI